MIHGRFTFKATIKTLIDIVAGKVVDASDDGPLDHVLEPSSIGGWTRWSIPKMVDQRDPHEYNSLGLPLKQQLKH